MSLAPPVGARAADPTVGTASPPMGACLPSDPALGTDVAVSEREAAAPALGTPVLLEAPPVGAGVTCNKLGAGDAAECPYSVATETGLSSKN